MRSIDQVSTPFLWPIDLDLIYLLDSARAHAANIRVFTYHGGDKFTKAIKRGKKHTMELFLHTDQHQPWREQSWSRMYVLSDRRSSASFWSSQAGMFSLAVIRAISFGTLLSRLFPLHGSIDAFYNAVNHCRSIVIQEQDRDRRKVTPELREAMLVCNPCAYSPTYNAGRSVKLAPALWEISLEWPEMIAPYLARGEKMSWANAYNWITTCGMPQMGAANRPTLTAYLLAADLVYTELVEMPTAREVGELIWHLRMGGYRGLQTLSLVESQVTGRDRDQRQRNACINAFVTLYDFVRLGLGPLADEHGFNPIVLEHSLCKYLRFKATKPPLLPFPKTIVDAEAMRVMVLAYERAKHREQLASR